MEQQATTSEVNQTEVKKDAKKPVTESRVITQPILLKSGINASHSFVLDNFAKSLGTLIANHSEKFEVTLFGGKIIVPSITSKTDNRDRVLTFLKGLVNNLFKGMELQAVLPATEKDKILVLSSLKKAGFKFTTFNKVEVSTSVEIWSKFKKSESNVSKQNVIAENTGLISKTNVNNELYKVLKAANLSHITGLEIGLRKQLNLPSPNVD